MIEAWALATCSDCSTRGSHEGLTQLDEIVDGQQELRLLRDGLYCGCPILFIRAGNGLGVLVAGVQERAHDHVIQVPTQVREVPVAYGRKTASAGPLALTAL